MNDSIRFVSSLGTGGVIEVTFNDFVLRTGDTLYIYSNDGAASRTLIATLFENERAKRGVPFRFYSRPNDGALTFVLVSDAGVPKGIGWNATVREASARSTVDLLSVMSPGGSFINDGDSVFKVCAVTTLQYNAIASAPSKDTSYRNNGDPTLYTYTYTPNQAAFTYTWISNDGNANVNTQTFSQSYGLGSVRYTLSVRTDNCIQYDTTFRVNVSPRPNFAGTSGDQVICEGTDVQITGNAMRAVGTNVNGSPGYTYSPNIDTSGWASLNGGGFSTLNVGNVVRVPAPNTLAGAYMYRFSARDNYGCSYDTTITVTVSAKRFAGADLAKTICGDQNGYNLNDAADPAKAPGGIWRDLDNTGFLTNATSGSFDAQNWIGTSPVQKTARFSYFLTPNPGCVADSSVITLTVFPVNFAGTSKLITVCNTETSVDLLGANGLNTNQTAGTFVIGPPIAYGTLTSNRFLNLTTGGSLTSPAGYVSGNGGAPYIWRYTVNNGVCPADQATLQILVNETGVPGGSDTIDLCTGGPIAMLFDSLKGTPDNNGTWTITAGGVLGGTDPNRTFDPAAQTQSGPFTATYTVRGRDGVSVCRDTTANILIRFQTSPRSGDSLPRPDVCTSAGTYDLFNTLAAGTYDNVGTWSFVSGSGSLSGTNNNIVDLNTIIPAGANTVSDTFRYTVSTTNTICNSASTTVAVRFTRKSNAGVSGSITVCENSPNFTLAPILGTPDASTVFTGGPTAAYTAAFPGTFTPAATGLAGNTYTITATDSANGPGCPPAVTTITISVNVKPEAGLDSDTAKACLTDMNYDLKTLLSSAVTSPDGFWTLKGATDPASNPTWLNPNGLVSIQASSVFPGCGKYQFDYHDTAFACAPDISTHSLTVRCLPDAGPDDSTYVCSSDPTFRISDFLGTTDTTGTFVDVNGSGGLTPLTYKGVFNPVNVATGRYEFQYLVDNKPCYPPDTARIFVYVSKRPSAGTSNDTLAACEDETAYDLYQLLGGTYQRKGKWVVAFNGAYDASINATVESDRKRFFGGADSNELNVVELLKVIESSSSPFFKNRPSSFPPFVRLRYIARDTTNFGPTPPLCPDSIVTAVLEISKKWPTPTPKVAVPTEICSAVCSYDLTNLLNNYDFYPYGPEDSIRWVSDKPINPSNISGSMIQPCLMDTGTYNFTLTIHTAGCDDITVPNVKLRIVPRPFAGPDTSVTLCISNGPVSLTDIRYAFPGVTKGGSFTAVTPADGLGTTTYTPGAGNDTAGTYVIRYTVASAVCGSTTASSLITLRIVNRPNNPGNKTITVCEGTTYQLKNAIPTADKSGRFRPISCTDAVVFDSDYETGVFKADSNIAGGLCIVEYCVPAGGCPKECLNITVNVTRRPRAGADKTDTICSTETAYSLATQGGDLNGSYGAQNGVFSGTFNATMVVAPTTVFIPYIVSAAGCASDTANITLFVEKAPRAGTNATRDFCSTTGKINLTDQLNGERDTANGYWTSISPIVALSGPHNEFLDISTLPAAPNNTYTLRYTVTGKKCPNDQSTLTLRVTRPANTGRDTTITLCKNSGEYDLKTALGSSFETGGSFFDAGGIPNTDVITPGNYPVGTTYFTYRKNAAPCPASSTKITVNISPVPNSGTDRTDTIFLCANGSTANFNTYLVGSTGGGVWRNAPSNGTFNITSAGILVLTSSEAGKKGTVIYVTSSPGCVNDTAYFNVSVNTPPAAQAAQDRTFCLNDTPIDLNSFYSVAAGNTLAYSITPQAGTNNQAAINGSALIGNTFYPGNAGNGTYIVTVTQSNQSCPSQTSNLTLRFVGPGTDTAIQACINAGPIDLVTLTRAQGIAGSWVATPTAPGLVVGNIFFPRAGVANTTYSVELNPSGSVPNCTAKARITIVDTISLTTPGVEYVHSGTFYQIRFTPQGGTAPYAVSGLTGTFSGTTFTSDPIACGAPFSVMVTSSANCGNLLFKGSSECGDQDSDGIYDLNDLDDDNDGIPDIAEARGEADAHGDHDGNGIPNYRDAGYCALGANPKPMNGNVCSKYDSDGDGIINQFDLDSDNDGISDIFEGFDATNAVTFESGTIDGKINAFVDVNKDGWHDPAAVTFGTIPTFAAYDARLIRTGGVSALPDFLNEDSDRDSISDRIEGGGSIFVAPVNTDGTGGADFRDTDSDNDGILDMWEAGMDGNINTVPDSDNDGTPDFRDLDSDNDGIFDRTEHRAVNLLTGEPEDFDKDGKFNFQDDDSDNDNIADEDEAGPTPNTPRVTSKLASANPDYLKLDSDDDGICDLWEGHRTINDRGRPVDTDGDGLADYMDTDADNDGIPDGVEASVLGNPGGCFEPSDSDGDGIYDFREEDSDDDGLLDKYEAGEDLLNPAESLLDDDNIRNFQDKDSDGDCIPDKYEVVGPGYPNVIDGEAYAFLGDKATAPDYLNLDSDGDGIPDSEESGITICGSDQAPTDTDKDGFPDFRDLDSDNDGVNDRIEKDGDCDGDGTPNYRDAGDNCDITTFVPQGFSPNNDGTNDMFVIPDISEFPNASLKIFNRWGGLIFESSNYTNNWDGRYNGEDVPQGTYFYLLDLGIGKDAQKGYIYINR
ncbi:MAG: gliding motility-associated C-terminal domain-containing protein [Bacteroidota bacterium]